MLPLQHPHRAPHAPAKAKLITKASAPSAWARRLADFALRQVDPLGNHPWLFLGQPMEHCALPRAYNMSRHTWRCKTHLFGTIDTRQSALARTWTVAHRAAPLLRATQKDPPPS
jgi:hypothetical protein